MMTKQKMLTVRMDEQIYKLAKEKCDNQLGVPLASLVKIFLRSFIAQSGVGFYVGDQDLARLINRWIRKRRFETERGGRVAAIEARLRDIFELQELRPGKN